MRRNYLVLILISILFLFSFRVKGASDFDRGVAYLLMKDTLSAQKYFSDYFMKNYNPIVKSGFSALLRGDMNAAKNEFNRYLNMNFRSTEALVGISIAVSDMKQSTSIENLRKTIKLNPRFAAGYACLGYEYQKRDNFPMAERYFLLALKNSGIPEFRILLGNLYFVMNDPRKAVSMIENEVDNYPDNFLINFLMARSLCKLGRIGEMTKYINICLELKGKSREVLMLYSDFLYRKKRYSQAKTILKSIRTSGTFDKEYIKLYAKTLIKVGDRKAKDMLYLLYSKFPWDEDVNYLMAEYYLKNKNEKGNIQNWIYRAILSGSPISQLRSQFKDDFYYPEINRIKFFKVMALKWLDNSTVVVTALLKSGDAERIFVVDTNKKRIVRSFQISGTFSGMFVSNSRDKIVVTSSVSGGIYVYAIERKRGLWSFSRISKGILPVKEAKVKFNSSDTLAYIVEGNIEKLAFESPFARVNRFGEKSPVYPNFSFKVYKYNFRLKRFNIINDISEMERVPCDSLKKYFMVLHANNTTDDIRKLIEKGKTLDVISPEMVKIVFSENLDSFAIYLADLKNAFQAVVFNNDTGEITKVDETMFLGKNVFAELNILKFDSINKRFIFSTRDKRKNLIIFNYKTKLFISVAEHFFSGCFDADNSYIYFLTERDIKYSLTETMFQMAKIEPFWRDEISSRRDINKIEGCGDILNIKVITNRGEMLSLDHNNKFTYISPSYEGTVFDYSPHNENVALFNNGYLYFFNSKEAWDKTSVSRR